MSAAVQPEGNLYDKYRTGNPVARALMRGFLDAFDALTGPLPVTRGFEVGCGEGELSIRLAQRGWRMRGCDVSGRIVDEARRRAARAGVDAEFRVQRIESLDAADAAPLVVCCEVLEHVDDPVAGVATLAALADPYLVASVPREPLWRVLNLARGKYVGALGNTPGHVNHWSRRGFLELLGARFDIVDVRSPLPWTIALCRRR